MSSMSPALIFLCIAFTALHASDLPSIEVPFIEHAPSLDEFQGMRPGPSIEGKMALAKGFIQRQPRDGQDASNDTHVYMAYDKKNFYAVFLCFDSEPDKIRANMTPREQVFKDDYVDLQIDTQNDRRRAYTFLSTARGVQWDALWTEGKDYDQNYDAIWHSEGRRNDQGYMVLMIVPFTTLRFNPGEQTWAIMLNRSISRFSEESYWPRYTIDIEGRLNQAATVTGIRDVSPGRDIRLNPYVFARNYRSLDRSSASFQSDDFDPEVGLDAKMVVFDSFILDLTANPDFSQVESDEPQVTVNQRFEVQFPERRPFFLENADFFRTLTPLVFTRRIVDPSAGLRLTGKKNGWSLGVMAMDDESAGQRVDVSSPDYGDAAGIGIVRINRDILNQSTVGLLHTQWEFGEQSNRVTGVDARIKFNSNWVGDAQIAHSVTEGNGDTREGDLYNATLNRNGRHISTHTHFLRTDSDFATKLGFLNSEQRPGTMNLHHNVDYYLRPNDSKVVFWGPSIGVSRTWDLDEEVLDKSYSLSWTLKLDNNLQFWTSIEHNSQRLTPYDFTELDDDLELSEDTIDARAEIEVSPSFSFYLYADMGDGINFVPVEGQIPHEAETQRIEGNFTWRPISPLQIDGTYFYLKLEDQVNGDKIFDNSIARIKANWQFTREWSLRAISQLDDTKPNEQATRLKRRRNWNTDLLLRYVVNPWTALYLGTNKNDSNFTIVEGESGRTVIPTDGKLSNDGRQYFLKFSYLFQF